MRRTRRDGRVALITGTFDLLHDGHVNLIRQALDRTDKLTIGLETDVRVRARKGEGRPFYNQEQRRARLASIVPDVKVLILPENFGEEQVRLDFLRQEQIKVIYTAPGDPFMLNKQILMMQVGGRVELVTCKWPVAMTRIIAGEQPVDYLLFEEDKRLVERLQHGQT